MPSYISLAMSPNRFAKSGGRDMGPSEVIYRDRTTWAVDAQLASLASSGDDSAFTTLVTRFHPAVFRWALMFASDPDEAEDITQEVFVRTYRQLDQYRSDGPLDAWLYRMTRRGAAASRSRRRRSPFVTCTQRIRAGASIVSAPRA